MHSDHLEVQVPRVHCSGWSFAKCARSHALLKCTTMSALVVGSRQGGLSLATSAGIGQECMARRIRQINALSWQRMKKGNGTKCASAAWAVPKGRNRCAGDVQCQRTQDRRTQNDMQWEAQKQTTEKGSPPIATGTLQTWSEGSGERAIYFQQKTLKNVAKIACPCPWLRTTRSTNGLRAHAWTTVVLSRSIAA